MRDSPVKRSIEDFLVNPTIRMDEQYSYEERCAFSESLIPVTPPKELLAFKPRRKNSKRAGGIEYFNDETSFWRGYTSDEEVASPIDNDDFSFISTNSEGESAASIGEQSSHSQKSNNAQQLCSRAQAVQVVSAGKAKVVTMPKLVEFPAIQRDDSMMSRPDVRPPPFRKNRVNLSGSSQYSNSSCGYSSRSSAEETSRSPTSSPHSGQPQDLRFARQKLKSPRNQVVASPESLLSTNPVFTPKTAWPARRLNFSDHDPPSLDSIARSHASSSATKSIMHKFSSFGLRGLSRRGRRSGAADGSSAEDVTAKKDLEAPVRSPVISDMHIPSRTSSKPPPKLIPRSANERAAPIILPPCPDEYEDDFPVPQWPPRSDSVATMMPNRTNTNPAIMHSRRKSLSAFVSVQA